MDTGSPGEREMWLGNHKEQTLKVLDRETWLGRHKKNILRCFWWNLGVEDTWERDMEVLNSPPRRQHSIDSINCFSCSMFERMLNSILVMERYVKKYNLETCLESIK
ncbi:hypothetical protein NPIL_235741 [Nephila pilipes]|uniref:Uncharacterized protein n=1 Tax=Nephila pilipes TaxID=299642 RepID=A0A8X6MMC0_NEPPI|nr:hypothetical protein NPIL_235741 [Nephila pilipes]